MLAAAIQSVLAILQVIAPGATADLIAKIIVALETWIPIIIKEYEALKQPVLNIIAALRGNDQVSTEQLNLLDVMEAKLDSDFDASSAAADAEDAANGGA